jgi:hypothetical protein
MANLMMRGYYVWRQNNHATRGRRFIGMAGLPDIIGYCRRSGRAVYCEVKTQGDRLSDEQITFLTHAYRCGCFAYIAMIDTEGNPQIMQFNGSAD